MKNKNQIHKLTFHPTITFKRNFDAYTIGFRYIINQGGIRSGKSYAIVMLLIMLCFQKKIDVTIVRQSLPDLRKSVMKDFFDIMKAHNLYEESLHNKTENIYTFPNGSTVSFMGAEGQKVRGSKRDVLYCTEVNELSYDDFFQLSLRTTGQIFVDYNPSDVEHWIYKLLENTESSTLIKSTYKDNPYLPQQQVNDIEQMIRVDENYYRVFALGERPTSNTRIYTHFKTYIHPPELIEKSIFGLDFGYNHNTALIRLDYSNNAVYASELIYESKLTTDALIERLKACNVGSEIIYCDYSRPEIIESLRLAGYNAKAAQKQVLDGINTVKSTEVYINAESTNLWKESKLYSWHTDKDGKPIDEPIKQNDHALDALRYALYTGKRNTGGVFSTEWTFIN